MGLESYSDGSSHRTFTQSEGGKKKARGEKGDGVIGLAGKRD